MPELCGCYVDLTEEEAAGARPTSPLRQSLIACCPPAWQSLAHACFDDGWQSGAGSPTCSRRGACCVLQTCSGGFLGCVAGSAVGPRCLDAMCCGQSDALVLAPYLFYTPWVGWASGLFCAGVCTAPPSIACMEASIALRADYQNKAWATGFFCGSVFFEELPVELNHCIARFLGRPEARYAEAMERKPTHTLRPCITFLKTGAGSGAQHQEMLRFKLKKRAMLHGVLSAHGPGCGEGGRRAASEAAPSRLTMIRS